MIKAIKIDPIKQQVEAYEWKNTEDFQELYGVIGCRTVQVVRFDNNNFVLCDEEGRLKEIEGAFRCLFSRTIIVGIGVVVGIGETEDFANTTIGVEDVIARIRWIAKEDCASLKVF